MLISIYFFKKNLMTKYYVSELNQQHVANDASSESEPDEDCDELVREPALKKGKVMLCLAF